MTPAVPRPLVRLWRHVAFLGRVAWPGAALGSVLATILFTADMAIYLRSGLGTLVDVAAIVVLTVLALAVLGLMVIALRTVLRTWPGWFAAALLGSLVLVLISLDAKSRLVFMVADTGENPDRRRGAPAKRRTDPIDFTIEITTADGVVSRVPLSRIALLPPILRVRFTKWGYLDRAFYRRDTEPVFQTYEMPLALFAAPGWTPARLRHVRLVFDRTPSGVIALNEVGFSRPSDADESDRLTPGGS